MSLGHAWTVARNEAAAILDNPVRTARYLPFAVVCLLVFTAARPAYAYRPFDGTDADVAEAHLFELEFSPLSYARFAQERSLIVPQVTLNYGTGSGFEFVLEGQGVMLMHPEPEGVSPRLEEAAFSLKKVLRAGVLQEKKGPSIATEESVLIPSRGQLHAGFGIGLIVSQPLSAARTMLHLNAELARTQEQLTERVVTMILEGPEEWPVRPVGELSWAREGDEDAVRALLAGIVWQTRQGLAMDAAVKTTDAGDEHALELRAGFTWKMQVHKGE
ncbi:MAG: hypothetical protein ABIU54_03905 [Candidatus Eisenbacteria bacterium]